MAEKKAKKPKNPLVAVWAGAVAGAIEVTATYPTEYVKTQLQLQQKGPKKYNGFFDCIAKTVRESGPIGLYRGLGPLFVASIPKAAVRFGAFDLFKQSLKDKNGKMTATSNLLAGAAAGVTEAVLVVTPQETLKTKLVQINKGFIAGTVQLVREGGVRAIYQGVFPTILKQASNQGIRFVSYNKIKDLMQHFRQQPGTELPVELAFVGGLGAGAASVLGNNPIDVVKTRMQGLDAKAYSSSFDCARKIATQEGMLAFYKGTAARMGRVVPGQGIIFACYETIERQMARWMGEEL